MKKLLSLIISAVLIFSVFPNMNVEAANTNKEAGKAYADIIQNYLTAAELGADAEVSDKINPEFLGGLYYSSGTMYRIMDYNNDGVPELFVGLKSSGFDSGTIYDVYTPSDVLLAPTMISHPLAYVAPTTRQWALILMRLQLRCHPPEARYGAAACSSWGWLPEGHRPSCRGRRLLQLERHAQGSTPHLFLRMGP